MVNFDNSWRALVRPASVGRLLDLDPLPPFDPEAQGFSLVNACWLAEMSRLMYRREAEDRDAILGRVGWRERCFIDEGGTQCALIEPRHAGAAPCTALAFRGSSTVGHWRSNVDTLLAACSAGGRTHRGFERALDRAWDRLAAELDAAPGPMFHTGHSLGAALALLATARRPERTRATYLFGCPRVGDRAFCARLADQPIFSVVNNHDLVAAVPPTLGPLAFCVLGQTRHIGRDSSITADGPPPGPASPHPDDTRRWRDPPRRLADHAPINYVAHLQRAAILTPAWHGSED